MIQSKALSIAIRYGFPVVLAFGLGIRVGVLSVRPQQTPSGTSYTAPRAVVTERVPISMVPTEIAVLKPSEKQKKKIEKELGAPLPKGDIANINIISKLPYGGKAVVFLEPLDITKPDGPKTARLEIYPNKRPLFEWLKSRELSAYYGIGGNLQGVRSLEYRQDLFRLGSATVNVKVGATQFPGTGSRTTGVEPYAMVGASVKF